MATVTRIRRLVNPRRHKVRVHRRRNLGRRRKMTAKQIRYFGTKRQRAALKTRHRTASKHHSVRRRVRKANPALVLTLGAINPSKKRRRVKVARIRRRRKSSNPRRRRRSRNAHVVVVAPRRRRAVSRRRRSNPRRRHARRRNPTLFGQQVRATQMGTAILGGLVGVAAAKFIPTMIPGGLVSGNIMRTVATGASAWVASFLAGKFNKQFGDAVLFGGLMQTGSVALNAFLPALGKQIGLSGMGELVPGQFPVPQNPIRAGIPAPAPAANARVTVNGLARAYGSAF